MVLFYNLIVFSLANVLLSNNRCKVSIVAGFFTQNPGPDARDFHCKISVGLFLVQEKGPRLCSVSRKQNQKQRFNRSFKRYLLIEALLFFLSHLQERRGGYTCNALECDGKIAS